MTPYLFLLIYFVSFIICVIIISVQYKKLSNYNTIIDKYKKVIKKLNYDNNVLHNDNEYLNNIINEYKKHMSNKVGQKPTQPKKQQFNVDDILTKINKVGIKNLTKEELDFLYNQKNK